MKNIPQKRKVILILLFLHALTFSYSQFLNFNWATQFKSISDVVVNSIVEDKLGNVYSTGYFSGTADFDPGPGTYNLSSSGGSFDIFITKLDVSGNFVWAKQIGGTKSDVGQHITIDTASNIYISGCFQESVIFNNTGGALALASLGGLDAYILKLNSSGNFIWVRRFGGTNWDYNYCSAVDAAGNVYSTGYYYGSADFDPGSGTTIQNAIGGSDIWVTKLNSSGNFVWAKSMGGFSADQGRNLVLDNSGNVLVTGKFQGLVDLDPGSGVISKSSNGGFDVFVLKLNSAGIVQWANSFGGTGHDEANSIDTDGFGNVYSTGSFEDTVDFDPGVGVVKLKTKGLKDIYISKLSSAGNYSFVKHIGGLFDDEGNSIVVDDENDLLITGSFKNAADFDPGVGSYHLSSTGGSDIFVLKLNSSGDFKLCRPIGGFDSDAANAIIVNSCGTIHVGGLFRNTVDFDTRTSQYNLTSGGNMDGFVLKMGQLASPPIFATTCGSYILPSGKVVSTSGTHFDTLTASSGCDSIIMYELTIGQNHLSTRFDSICSDQTHTLPDGRVVNKNGKYHSEFSTASGCDSIIISYLYVFDKNLKEAKFSWAKSMGGTKIDLGFSMVSDDAGNVYSVGLFQGTADFDPGPGTFNMSTIASAAFISKLDVNGNFVWAKSIPTGSGEYSNAEHIRLDRNGNLIISGYFDGILDFDPGPGIYNLTSTGNDDIFILKLTSSGSFVWASKFDGSFQEFAYSSTTDAFGNIYTTGSIIGTVDFDPGPGVNLYSTVNHGIDIYVNKLDSSGNYIWAKGIGGIGQDAGRDIVSDIYGNTYVTGYFDSIVDFDPGSGVASLTSAGGIDLFILKFDPNGNFQWVKRIGSTGNDQGNAIELDPSGNIYITGFFDGTVDFNPGAGVTNLVSSGGQDCFILKLDPSGNFVFVKKIGGSGTDKGESIVLDVYGNIYTAGSFRLTLDFDPGLGTYNLTSNGDDDIFISKLDKNGDFLWAKTFGSGSIDRPREVHVDRSGNIYGTGFFYSTVDFDPSGGIYSLTSKGVADIYVLKLTPTLDTIVDTNCGFYTLGSGRVVTISGVYNDTAISLGGCDSILIYDITILLPKTRTICDSICLGDSYTTIGGKVVYKSGTYVDTILSSGCDSIITTKLYSKNGFGDSTSFEWAFNAGSNNREWAYAVTTDNFGNVYTVGFFKGTVDFDPGPGTFNMTSASSSNDVFVQKLDTARNFIWAIKLSGNGGNYGRAIVVDNNGNVFLGGEFSSTIDLDPGVGTFNITAVSIVNSFVVKLDSAGNFVWGIARPGTGYSYVRGIDLDGAGNVYTTGFFHKTVDFDPSASTFNLTAAGFGIKHDAYVSKLDPSGNFIWAKSFSGSAEGYGSSIAVDNAGNSYTSGYFYSSCDFDPGVGSANLNSSGIEDAYLVKLNSAGNYVWAHKFGSHNSDYGNCVTIDNNGDLVLTGNFGSTVDFDPGPGIYNLTGAGFTDIFTMKLSSTGNFIWARGMGSTSFDAGLANVVDGYGNIYFAGNLRGTADMDPSSGTTILNPSLNKTTFVSKFNSSGDFKWSKLIGGGMDGGRCLALDNAGGIYGVGFLNGTEDFDPGPGTYNLTSNGQEDIYVFKLGQSFSVDTTYDTACGSYTLSSGTIVSTSGIYSDTSIGSTGCDSIVVYNIKINKSTTSYAWASACDSFVSPTGKIWNLTGVYNDTILNSVNCDSIITFTVNIKYLFRDTVVQQICDSIFWRGKSLIQSGFYSDTVYSGCDTIYTIDLTVDTSVLLIIDTTLCSGDSIVLLNGTVIKTTGKYYDTIVGNSSTSLVLKNLYHEDFENTTHSFSLNTNDESGISPGVNDNSWIVNNSYAGGTFFLGGFIPVVVSNTPNQNPTFTGNSNSNYLHIYSKYAEIQSGGAITNSNYFDSSLAISGLGQNGLNFCKMTNDVSTMGKTNVSFNFYYLCKGSWGRVYYSFDGGITWTQSGVNVNYSPWTFFGLNSGNFSNRTKLRFAFGFDNRDGITDDPAFGIDEVTIRYLQSVTTSVCDTIITYNVTVSPINDTNLYDTICSGQSFTLPGGGMVNGSGIYRDTLTGSACDSIIITHLTVNDTTSFTSDTTVCNSFVSPNGKMWTTSGTYYDTISNTVGCDSIMRFNLTVNYSSPVSFVIDSICDTIIREGIFGVTSPTKFTFTNISGCDSIVWRSTRTFPLDSTLITISSCDSVISSTGKVFKTSGSFQDTLFNKWGCDSILFYEVTIDTNTSSVQTISTCDSLVSPSGKVWTMTGTYFDTIPNTTGCDSLMTFHLTISSETIIPTAVSVCDSFVWRGITYTSSTMKSDTVAGVVCDTIYMLDLTIDTNTTSTQNIVTCDSLVSPSGKVWKTSNTYFDTIPNASGCDSLITINLTVSSETIIPTTVATCDSFVWRGTTYTSSTMKSDTVTGVVCDTIYTLYLTIGTNTTSTQNIVTCDSLVSPSGKVWKTSNTYFDTIPNASGCDSLMTINLTISSETIIPTAVSVCDSFVWRGTTYTSSTMKSDTVTGAVCDTIYTLDLTIDTNTTSTQNIVTCDSLVSPSGKVWKTSNTYFDTIPNASGCDSLITINLTVSSETIIPTTVATCDSFVWRGTTYTSSTMKSDTVTGVVCDTIYTLYLTIGTNTTSTQNIVTCDSLVSPSGKVWKTSNTYFDTIPNASGCDSLMTINLTISSETIIPTAVSVCDSFVWRGTTYTSSTMKSDTVTGAVCDTIYTLDLTIDTNTSSTQTISACDSLVSPSGKVWKTSNTYFDTIPNAAGCDSLMTFNLTISSETIIPTTVATCDSFVWRGTTYTSSTMESDTVTGPVCDTIYTLDLTIDTNTNSTQTISACDSLVSPSGKVWKTSNTYFDTIPNASGCDSLMTFNLTISNETIIPTTVATCDSFVWRGTTYTSSTMKSDTVTGVVCDTIYTLYLTIDTNTTSTQNIVTCDSLVSPSGKVWKTSNTYFDTIPNAAGCDSIITFLATINNSTQFNRKDTACDSLISPNGKIWTTSGTYYDTIINSRGCDSIITFDLIIRNSTTSSHTVTVCDSLVSPSGKIWTSSGNYLDTILNSVGCDSVLSFVVTINTKPIIPLVLMVCDSFEWRGTTYYSSIIYRDTVAGPICDTVYTLDLTVNHSTMFAFSVVVCDSFVSPSGKVWRTTGSYNDTITNATGCDSILIISVLVNNSTSSNRIDTVCDSLTSPNGKVWNSSGTYLDTLINANGCDSVVIYNLTVRNSTFSSTAVTACDSLISPSGKIWRTSNTYFDTIPNAAGCDSIISIAVTINNTTYSSQTVVACDSFISPSGKKWFSIGSYFDTILSTVGCDSIISFSVIINNSTSSTQTVTVCDTLISPSGKVWTVSGNYTDTILNSVGCDSILTLNVLINKSTISSQTVVVCDSLVSPSGEVWTSSGNYQDTIANSVGCDSIISVNLTVNFTSRSTQTLSVCDSLISPSGKKWIASGNYVDTINNISGCDSIITYNLTVGYSSFSNQSLVACDSLVSPSGKVWTSSGNYQDTILNSDGCDSVITFIITINYASASYQSINQCDSFISPSGKIWTNTGNYIDTILNSDGCDSVMNFNLIIDTATSSSYTLTVCDSLLSPSGKVWTASGLFSDTISNAKGCDSLMNFNLTVLYSSTRSSLVTACDSFVLPSGVVVTSSGVYDDTLIGSNGCDSIISTILIIGQSYQIPQNVTICSGDTFSIGMSTYSSPGIYNDTFLTILGCDSVIITNLTVIPITYGDITFAQNLCENDQPAIFTATPTGGTWSGTGIDPISGSFDPSITGVGTFKIFYTPAGACVRSDSISVSIFPQPMIDFDKLDDQCKIGLGEIDVTILSGTAPFSYSWSNSSTSQDLTKLKKGTYFLSVVDSNGCMDTVSVKIIDDPKCVLNFFVPNIFTPDGNGENDIFRVEGFGILEVKLTVFNRWGNLMYESTSLTDGWDGTYKGAPVNQGVFVYFVTGTYYGGETFKEKGTVTLLR